MATDLQNPVDRAGTFRGRIVEYNLYKKEDTGSVSLFITAELYAMWYEGEWYPWESYGQQAGGIINLVTGKEKGNKLNQVQCESLRDNAGWDGRFASLNDEKWEPISCQFSIKKECYNNKEEYRISWINGYDDTPGSGKVAEDEIKALEARFGGELRALGGNKKRNAAPTSGDKPSAPPKTEAKVEAGDIPF